MLAPQAATRRPWSRRNPGLTSGGGAGMILLTRELLAPRATVPARNPPALEGGFDAHAGIASFLVLEVSSGVAQRSRHSLFEDRNFPMPGPSGGLTGDLKWLVAGCCLRFWDSAVLRRYGPAVPQERLPERSPTPRGRWFGRRKSPSPMRPPTRFATPPATTPATTRWRCCRRAAIASRPRVPAFGAVSLSASRWTSLRRCGWISRSRWGQRRRKCMSKTPPRRFRPTPRRWGR